MEQIYLIKKNELAKKIKNMTFKDGTYILSSEFENHILIHVINEKDNNISAKSLSDANIMLLSNYSNDINLLIDGCSQYCEKKLFPLFNEFEIKLRMLLKLCCILNGNTEIDETIKDIEFKSFGELFELLFTTTEFNNECKKLINQKNHNFSKKELLNQIEDLKEVTLWDTIVGDNEITELKDNYLLIKDYRNDVMHAHSISYEKYQEINKLMLKVNVKLDLFIKKIAGIQNSLSNTIRDIKARAKTVNEKIKEYNKSYIEKAKDLLRNLYTLETISKEIRTPEEQKQLIDNINSINHLLSVVKNINLE